MSMAFTHFSQPNKKKKQEVETFKEAFVTSQSLNFTTRDIQNSVLILNISVVIFYSYAHETCVN